MRHSKWLGIALVGGAVGVAAVRGLGTTPAVDVETTDVSAGPIVRRILATGTLQAVNTVDVGSQVTGIVNALPADFNSVVRAGQVIAQLDPSLLQLALDQARANLDGAQAAVSQAQASLMGLQATEENAELQLDRARSLATGQLIEQAALDAAQTVMDEASDDMRSGEAQLDQAKAGVTRAEADVKEASVNLDRTVIRSPIDGIVLARNVEVGQTVSAALSAPVLFSIADIAEVQVQVDIDEADIGSVEADDPATFTVEAYPDETFDGTVRQVRLQPTVAGSVVAYTAIISVRNPDARLRPGMTAEVSLVSSRREHAVRIPNSALAFRPPADVLRALGQADPPGRSARAESGDASTRPRELWRFDGRRFTPVAVTVGLADDRWSELLGGPIAPGDALATSAIVRRTP